MNPARYFAPSFFAPRYFGTDSATDPGSLLGSTSGFALVAGSLTARGYLFGESAGSAAVEGLLTQASGDLSGFTAGFSTASGTLQSATLADPAPSVSGGGGFWRITTPQYPLPRASRLKPAVVQVRIVDISGRAVGFSIAVGTITAAGNMAGQSTRGARGLATLSSIDHVLDHNNFALLLAA